MAWTLDQIAIAHGTDKATQFTRTYAKPKGYTVHYARFFEPLRDKPIKLVEIGVGGGESIRTWLEYFPNAFIVGIDNVKDTNIWNTPADFHEVTFPGSDVVRYHFHAADQTDLVFWKCFAADYGPAFDIAIDDGAHDPKAVQLSFECLWPLIKPSGYYCVEDLGCGFTSPGFPGHLDWIKGLMEKLNAGGSDIASLHYSPELLIIQKAL